MTQKILVTGFPHCGTTLIRSLIGSCKNVYDQSIESVNPIDYRVDMDYKFYVWKLPILPKEFMRFGFRSKPTTHLNDTIIIPIIRNPWNVFHSLYERSLKYNEFSILDNTQPHSLKHYINTAERIYEVFNQPLHNVYPIRYEDIFKNDFKLLKRIFTLIGLQYDDRIFYDNFSKFKHNNISYNENLIDSNNQYRVWQINQKISNKNHDKIKIPNQLNDELLKCDIINKLDFKDLGHYNFNIIEKLI